MKDAGASFPSDSQSAPEIPPERQLALDTGRAASDTFSVRAANAPDGLLATNEAEENTEV
jgi:hypothetical protein